MAFGYDDAAFAIIGLLGSRAQQKKQHELLDQQARMLMPYQHARLAALARAEGQIGKPSYRLQAAKEEALGEVAREEQTAERTEEAMAAGRGMAPQRYNTRMGAQRERNQIMLAEAAAEEERQTSLRQEVERLTSGATEGMLNVQQQRSAATEGGFSDLGTLVGTIYRAHKEGEAVKAGAAKAPPLGSATTTPASPTLPAPVPAPAIPIAPAGTPMQSYQPAMVMPPRAVPDYTYLQRLPGITLDDTAYDGLEIGGQYRRQRYNTRRPRESGADRFLTLAGVPR
jgi:uncharacterized membrane protein YebE (DUF533 family)